MAEMPPLLYVSGEVRRVTNKTFTDPQSGEVRPNRSFDVLTEGGFVKVKAEDALPLPKVLDVVEFVPVYVNAWARDGRSGVSYARRDV